LFKTIFAIVVSGVLITLTVYLLRKRGDGDPVEGVKRYGQDGIKQVKRVFATPPSPQEA
jgi:hypothetical protein